MEETIYRIAAPVHFSVALLADTHNVEPSDIAASLKVHQPDMIAIAGDILIGDRPSHDNLIVESQKNVLPLLSDCAAVAPTFLSLGNHEWMVCRDDIEILNSTGAVVLDNQFTFQTVNGMGVWIGGLSSAIVTSYQQFREKAGGRYPDRSRRSQALCPDTNSGWLTDFEKQDGYKLLLSHHPEYWSQREPWLSEKQIDLVFSGHAHGGQVRLFGRGLYAPAQGLLPRFTSGVCKGKYGSMIVSRGLSNTASPVPRLFNEPEIVYVEVGEDG